jgi:hypothetical protein
MSATKQITIRMPLELMAEIQSRGKSASFIIEAVRDRILRDKEEEFANSLLCLAGDAEANDISDFARAQAEVMARVD